MKRFKELFESPPGLTKPMEQSFTKSAHGAKPSKKKMEEQHREKGRFKPTIPHNVPSVLAATPKKVNEDFGKATPSVEEVAKKHGVTVDEINKQLEMGVKVEKEHTSDAKMAREIALDHLNEKPNYYSKLKKYVEMTDVEYQSAGAGARTLVDKPNREPMKTYKQFNKEEVEKHPFVAVHAKKGKHETHGSTSYEAAQNAAKHWKMKNTAGIDVYRADKKHIPEEVEQIDEVSDEMLSRYKEKAKASADELESQKKYGKALKRRVGVLQAVGKMTGRAGEKISQLAKEEKEPPFEGGTTKPKQKAIPGKLGAGYSTARHLARQAMKKQVEKMKPVKESLEESRKAEIVKEIVKKKKNDKGNSETFQKDPVLSSEITKA